MTLGLPDTSPKDRMQGRRFRESVADYTRTSVMQKVLGSLRPRQRHARIWFGVVLIALLSVLSVDAAPRNGKQFSDWRELKQRLMAAYFGGELENALPIAKQALELARSAFGPRDPRTLSSISDLTSVLEKLRRYEEEEPLLRELLVAKASTTRNQGKDAVDIRQRLARSLEEQAKYEEAIAMYRDLVPVVSKLFGIRSREAVNAMKELATASYGHGEYAEAEQVLSKALKISQDAFGKENNGSLGLANDLAMTFSKEGKFDKAEPILRENILIHSKNAGPGDPETVLAMANLADVLVKMGRFGEAEKLSGDAISLSRENLKRKEKLKEEIKELNKRLQGGGQLFPVDDDSEQINLTMLASMNSLSLALQGQGRYDEAVPLAQEIVERTSQLFGDHNSYTLTSMNNLGLVLARRGDNEAAERIDNETLKLRREILGPKHPDTLTSSTSLAKDYLNEGRNAQAESRYRESLQLQREVLGNRHPDTLETMGNLAVLLDKQGRYGDAEALYREALESKRDVLGPTHPYTLLSELNFVICLSAQGKLSEAIALQRQMEPKMLSWVGTEIYTTRAQRARRQLVFSLSDYQNVVLSLASQPNAGADSKELAASAVLRFKSLAVEEEGYLAHLQRTSPDQHIRVVATTIRRLHQQLAGVASGIEANDRAKSLTDELETKELELGQVIQGKTPYLQVKNVSLNAVRAALAPNSALLELRAYRATDFKTGEMSDWRWAGVLIPMSGDIEVRDLGAATETAVQVQAILANGASAKAASEALSAQILLPFSAVKAKLQRLYIAPDAVLSLLPFGLLQDTTKGRLMESVDVRTVQTGRDLLRPPAEHPAKGMIAVGGIDFDSVKVEEAGVPASEIYPVGATHSNTVVLDASPLTRTRTRTADTFRNGFAALASSKLEVEAISSQYGIWRRDEPVLLAEGTEPTKDWLIARSPARVLHLATHGFYREQKDSVDQPMLLAGLALAGANQGLKRQDASGILYALEAQDLNLEGTELVVLSACDTALGQIDYGEGVSGLVRALRTAGARNVLVTLRPVDDDGAERFMERFYYYWFKQEHSDPAAALRDAQREAATENESTWTSFVMIGG